MVHLIFLIALTAFVDCLDQSSFLTAHNGVFRALDWTNDELAEVSALHTTASYHKLMRIVALSESDIDDDARRRIEKFMVQKLPPKFLKNFLTDEDKDILLQLHAAGDFHEYALLLFKRLFELPKHQVITALRYFGYNTEADFLGEAECYSCAVIRLSERVGR
uniref:RxLR effector protein n=1 Tax=Angiostrongylus cantonensis TaxID=6313 RepID=A0A0K0DBJ0_ANGCA